MIVFSQKIIFFINGGAVINEVLYPCIFKRILNYLSEIIYILE